MERDELAERAKQMTAAGLASASRGLTKAARAAERTAARLHTAKDADAPAAPDMPQGAPPEPEGPATASPSAAAEARADDDVAALAEQPVRALTGEIPNLSTDRLRALRAHEEAGKARKTVLTAIDRQLASRED